MCGCHRDEAHLTYRARMDASPPRRSNPASGISRRGLLRLAATAGIAVTTAAACSPRTARPSSPPASSPALQPSSAPSTITNPPLAPVVSPSPASNAMLCRDAWRAAPPRAGGIPQVPNFMTVHHTAVVLGDNANAPARLRQHQHYHQDTQGWIDIAYHLSVDRRGNIYE